MAGRAPRQKRRVVIRIDGHVLLFDDFTLAECRLIEEATGVTWYALNPLGSAKEASAVLAAVLRRDVDHVTAQARVDAMTLREMNKHLVLEPYEDDDDRPAEYVDGVPVVDPPRAAGEPVTTSSS